MTHPKFNKWSITLQSLPLRRPHGSEVFEEEGTFIVDKVEVNGALIRCTGAALIMSPKAPVSLHLEIMPRDLEINMED